MQFHDIKHHFTVWLLEDHSFGKYPPLPLQLLQFPTVQNFSDILFLLLVIFYCIATHNFLIKGTLLQVLILTESRCKAADKYLHDFT
jgi:hypothetical protein